MTLNEALFPNNTLSRLSCLEQASCTLPDQISPLFQDDKCSAVMVNDGFVEYSILPVACNVSHPVALICEYYKQEKRVQNHLSDVKVVDAGHGFHRMLSEISCPYGWFFVNNVCIHLSTDKYCSNKDCQDANCQQKLADKVFHNISYNSDFSISNSSPLGKFWRLLHHKFDVPKNLQEITVTIKINASSVCKIIHNATQCHLNATMLGNGQIWYSDEKLWSLLKQPQLQPDSFLISPDFYLCELESFDVAPSTNCSSEYVTCSDGTCIHDALVCDGQEHCLHGEDENNCQHACDDSTINCLTECHYDNLCRCSPSFFQCLSGGCVPLQKLCDMTAHCADGSDEPDTCVYLTKEATVPYYRRMKIENNVDDLFTSYFKRTPDCLGRPPQPVQRNSYYGNHTDFLYHAVKALCTELYVISEAANNHRMILNHEPHSIYFEQLCVYKGAYDDICKNGFHLLNCEAIHCVQKFKCPSSYCIPRDHVCNNACECPHCEDESFCEKLLCPNMILFEAMGTNLYCRKYEDDYENEHSNRQVISTKQTKIFDYFPVYVHIENGTSLNNYITSPEKELIVYCIIHDYDFPFSNNLSFVHGMIRLKVLDISNNNIKMIDSKLFQNMAHLMILNLSYNLLSSISKDLFFPLKQLMYLLVHHNTITFIHANSFIFSPNLRVLVMQSNNLDSGRTMFSEPLPALLHLTSDLARLCCVFQVSGRCYPPFHPFISCSNMFRSKALVTTVWSIGGVTTGLNAASVVLAIIYHLRAKITKAKTNIVMLLSLNLNVCELLTSGCILSYPFINLHYQGTFGVMADIWRVSWPCFTLEMIFSISSQLALISATYSAVHMAVYIPSTARRKAKKRTTLFIIIMAWIIVSSDAFTMKYFKHHSATDSIDYFCLPFIMSSHQNPVIYAIDISFVMVDFMFASVCIACYSYLLVYVIKKRVSTLFQHTTNRSAMYNKVILRMATLMMTTSCTWIPILVLQIAVLVDVSIHPNVFFLVVIASLSANLTIDPVTIIVSLLKNIM